MNILKIISPINLEEERDKFFQSGENYNPILSYRWQNLAASEKAKLIASEANPKKRILIAAVLKQDQKGIVETAKDFFMTEITEENLSLAKHYLSKRPNPKELKMEEVKEEYLRAFHYFDLDYEIIETTDTAYAARPKAEEKKIYLSKSMKLLKYFSPKSTVGHEMAHILRYENGKFNNLAKSDDYLPTDEGLATYIHDYCFLKDNNAVYQHAAEYASTEFGLKGSFVDIYHYFKSLGFSPEFSWNRAIRHKFGFVKTSLPGDIMKPSMYFHNSQKVRALSFKDRVKLLGLD